MDLARLGTLVGAQLLIMLVVWLHLRAVVRRLAALDARLDWITATLTQLLPGVPPPPRPAGPASPVVGRAPGDVYLPADFADSLRGRP